MKYVWLIILEHLRNLHLIFRLAVFDIKGKYQMHYLGTLWQFLNPTIQVFIYWFVFGFGIRGGTSSVGGVPFIVWLIVGLVPWFFISPSILQASNSVYSKVNLVSKMKFPVSVLPSIVIVGNMFNFLVMLVIVQVILIIYGVFPSIYYLQILYYIFSLLIFLVAFTIFSSTLSTIIRDYQIFLQSVMRMLLYLSPVLWETSELPSFYENILKLNPLFYIIEGFRDTFFSQSWFFNDLAYTLYFWSITFLFLLLGSYLHVKFRKKFVDYL